MKDYGRLPERKVIHSRLMKCCVKAESTVLGYVLCVAVLIVMGLTGS